MQAPADPLRERVALEQRWLNLTRALLPAVARARGWPVDADHCFQRILLDQAVGGVWYAHVAKRPAFRHIAEHHLVEAVRLGEAALAGSVDLAALDRQSLRWRAAARRTGT